MKNLITVFCVIVFGAACIESQAADIEISDVNGHFGIVYFTVSINNAPNAVTYLKFMIPLSGDLYVNSGGDYVVGIAKNNILNGSFGYSSGAAGNGISVSLYFKEPLPKGSTGPILKIPLYINNTPAPTALSLINIEGDIIGWSMKDGRFIYVTDDNQNPIVDPGENKYVINSIVLDGSKCFDYDGMIVSWNWLLTHRSNYLYNRIVSGRNIVVNDLPMGVYDVQLTVTDNVGLTSTDFMVLSASGTYSINGDATGDGKVGMDDMVYVIQVLSGLRY